jgi:hypothetical protein
VHLIEIQAERPHEIELPRARTPDRDRLFRVRPNGSDGGLEERLQRAEWVAHVTGRCELETPLGFVHHVPCGNRVVVSVTARDRREDRLYKRAPALAGCNQMTAAAHLDVSDRLGWVAEMEVEERRQQHHAVVTCGSHHRIDIRKQGVVHSDRETVPIEPDAGPGVAQQKHTDECDAVRRHAFQRAIETGASRGIGREATRGRPGVCAEIGAVTDPRQVGAQQEPVRRVVAQPGLRHHRRSSSSIQRVSSTSSSGPAASSRANVALISFARFL